MPCVYLVATLARVQCLSYHSAKDVVEDIVQMYWLMSR